MRRLQSPKLRGRDVTSKSSVSWSKMGDFFTGSTQVLKPGTVWVWPSRAPLVAALVAVAAVEPAGAGSDAAVFGGLMGVEAPSREALWERARTLPPLWEVTLVLFPDLGLFFLPEIPSAAAAPACGRREDDAGISSLFGSHKVPAPGSDARWTLSRPMDFATYRHDGRHGKRLRLRYAHFRGRSHERVAAQANGSGIRESLMLCTRGALPTCVPGERVRVIRNW